jgi:hypothetical protein
VVFYSYYQDQQQILEDRSGDVTVDGGELCLPVFSKEEDRKIRHVLWLMPINKKINLVLLPGKILEE